MAKPNIIWEPFPGSQQAFLSCPAWECLLHGNRGGGKAQPLGSKILTPDGWETMKNMEVGSKICNPDGTVSTVMGVYPQGYVLSYKMSVDSVDISATEVKDISKLEFTTHCAYCTKDHLWPAKINPPLGRPVTVTTEQLKEQLRLHPDNPPLLPIVKIENSFNYNLADYNSYNINDGRVTGIEPHKVELCQCIKIDNPNGLYITDDFIVTHNTDVLIMDFLQGVGKGYGIDYAGLLLREATTELGDVIKKTKKWIPKIFPSAKFNNSKKIWAFEDGESLWLNYARVEDDYEQYHGHEYPWIGWEELTNHALPNIYLKLMSCNRSSNPDIQKKYRATCNPSGVGHGWVKERFISYTPAGKIITDEFGQTRTHIRSLLHENKALEKADPQYRSKLMAMTVDNKMLRDAWVDGSWDLITGGYFTDVWEPKTHILPNFMPPSSWKGVRSFDWGSSKPWSVTYGWETSGEQPIGGDLPYFPKGSMVIPNEIYGWNGKVDEGDMALSSDIADRTLLLDKLLFEEYGIRIYPGPADTSIWDVKDGSTIANSLIKCGCRWTKANKGPGSRVTGWTLLRQMLGAAKRKDLEQPHLYFLGQAQHHIRTLPLMQRDKKKPEDIDSDGEDHAMDSLRYLLSRKLLKFKRRKVKY